MEIGKTLYVSDRRKWRSWLSKNHHKEKEIWLIYYNKASGKRRIPYDDAVEEALCFGWIDSTAKNIDKDSYAQRFTPRRPNSELSELNRERIRVLILQGKMTPAGLLAVKNQYRDRRFIIASDIRKALQEDKPTWKNFIGFPETYKRIRVGWIEGARSRPDIFRQRLDYLVKMTKKNKMFGTQINSPGSSAGRLKKP